MAVRGSEVVESVLYSTMDNWSFFDISLMMNCNVHLTDAILEPSILPLLSTTTDRIIGALLFVSSALFDSVHLKLASAFNSPSLQFIPPTRLLP